MSESAPSAESSQLIWLLAAGLVVLAAYVALGWVRLAQQRETLRERAPGVLVAGGVLGISLCAATVLTLAGEALAFSLGYRALDAGMLCLAALAGCLVVCLILGLSQRWWVLVGCGVLLAGVATAVQMGWILAVGFRPGVAWRLEYVTLAVVLAISATATGVWLAFSSLSRSSERRGLWQLGAAVLVGLGLMASQELLLAAAGLPIQVGSIYRDEVPGTVLSLVLGTLLPLLLVVLAIDLAWRRSGIRHGKRRSSSFQGSGRSLHADGTPRKRRRRRRVRTL